MKKSVKKKWIKALRGGEFLQGKYRLREGDRYCCLGVLCTIEKLQAKRDIDDIYSFYYKNWESRVQLPGTMAKNLEISSDACERLANMNDQGYSFSEISDWIEENL